MEVPLAAPVSRLWEAVRPQRGGEHCTAPLPGAAWRHTVVGLHVFSALILVLTFVTALVADGPRDHTAAAAVGVLAAGYLLIGSRAVEDQADGRAVTYLVLLVSALGVVAWSDPSLLFLLTLAYPQVWFLVESPRPGLIWTTLLAGASTTGLVVGVAQRGGSTLSAAADSAVGLVFSVAMGLWVARVLAQSRQRAALIDELEQARSRLAEAHHSQGVMAERERLAREVHDTLAQGYTSVVVLAQTAAAELALAPERARERLTLIEEVARDNLRETRAIVAAFAPVALDGSTLVDALRRLAERFGRETGVAVSVDVDIPFGYALTRDDEIVLLRSAQEAMANARRHSGATTVALSLACEGAEVVVRVRDDGIGFDPAAALGTGLSGLRERVRQVGGALDVESSPGHGTLLAARVPVSL